RAVAEQPPRAPEHAPGGGATAPPGRRAAEPDPVGRAPRPLENRARGTDLGRQVGTREHRGPLSPRLCLPPRGRTVGGAGRPDPGPPPRSQASRRPDRATPGQLPPPHPLLRQSP